MRSIKICLACSSGGHLTEMLFLERLYSDFNHYFITFKNNYSSKLEGTEKVYFITSPSRRIIKFIRNFFESLKIFLKEKPDLVISTGAGTALATCLFAKLFGKKVIYIESFSRVKALSVTGKILYHFADLFLVQWEPILKNYPKARYWGKVI